MIMLYLKKEAVERIFIFQTIYVAFCRQIYSVLCVTEVQIFIVFVLWYVSSSLTIIYTHNFKGYKIKRLNSNEISLPICYW